MEVGCHGVCGEALGEETHQPSPFVFDPWRERTLTPSNKLSITLVDTSHPASPAARPLLYLGTFKSIKPTCCAG